MKLSKRLRHLADKLTNEDRGMGKTSLIAKAAKDLNGVILCHNFEFAKTVGHEHDVVAKSIEVNLDTKDLMGPYFIDHHAVAVLFEKAANRIEELEAQIKESNKLDIDTRDL